MSFIEKTTKFMPRETVAFRATVSGGIMINLQTGASFEVNRVGAEVWALVSSGNSVETIVETIRAKYDLAAETAETDVGRICADMLMAGLIARED